MRLLTSVLKAPVWNTAGHIDRTSLKTDPTEGTVQGGEWGGLGERKGDPGGWERMGNMFCKISKICGGCC